MEQRRFYGHPFSNNAMRAQLALDEKQLDYEYVTVDLFRGEQRSPEYLAITPRGQVPALVDGDVTLWESTAIVLYLEHRYSDVPLVPKVPRAMALAYRLFAEFNQKLDPTNIFGSVKFRGLRRAGLGERIDKLLAECRIWEGYAAAGQYLAGDDYSIADIASLPFFGVHDRRPRTAVADFSDLRASYDAV